MACLAGARACTSEQSEERPEPQASRGARWQYALRPRVGSRQPCAESAGAIRAEGADALVATCTAKATPSASVPTDQGLRAHHHQRIAPIKQLREKCQRCSRNSIDTPWFDATLLIQRKLPTQEEDFRVGRSLAASDPSLTVPTDMTRKTCDETRC